MFSINLCLVHSHSTDNRPICPCFLNWMENVSAYGCYVCCESRAHSPFHSQSIIPHIQTLCIVGCMPVPPYTRSSPLFCAFAAFNSSISPKFMDYNKQWQLCHSPSIVVSLTPPYRLRNQISHQFCCDFRAGRIPLYSNACVLVLKRVEWDRTHFFTPITTAREKKLWRFYFLCLPLMGHSIRLQHIAFKQIHGML